jgi:MraZ protein
LDGCLAIYPQAEFSALADRLAAASPAAREVRDYSRLFFSQAATVVPDAQGRFRVTSELTRWAELAGEVIVVGVRDHIEVWAAEKWERYVAKCDPQYDQLAELALIGAVRAAAHNHATQENGAPPSPQPATSGGRVLPR